MSQYVCVYMYTNTWGGWEGGFEYVCVFLYSCILVFMFGYKADTYTRVAKY